MNKDHLAAFPLNPQNIIRVASRYTHLLVTQGRIPITIQQELLAVPNQFYQDWWKLCKSPDDFIDLCSRYDLSEKICNILSDSRLLYYLVPETLADFMVYCRDVTRNNAVKSRKFTKAALLANKVRYDILKNMPEYIAHVNLLLAAKLPRASPLLRDFLERGMIVEQFHELSCFIVDYCGVKPAEEPHEEEMIEQAMQEMLEELQDGAESEDEIHE